MIERITKSHIITKKQLIEEIENVDMIMENLNELRKDIPNMTLFNLKADKDLTVQAKSKVQEAIDLLQKIRKSIKSDLKII